MGRGGRRGSAAVQCDARGERLQQADLQADLDPTGVGGDDGGRVEDGGVGRLLFFLGLVALPHRAVHHRGSGHPGTVGTLLGYAHRVDVTVIAVIQIMRTVQVVAVIVADAVVVDGCVQLVGLGGELQTQTDGQQRLGVVVVVLVVSVACDIGGEKGLIPRFARGGAVDAEAEEIPGDGRQDSSPMQHRRRILASTPFLSSAARSPDRRAAAADAVGPEEATAVVREEAWPVAGSGFGRGQDPREQPDRGHPAMFSPVSLRAQPRRPRTRQVAAGPAS
eukprot:scaffold4518_cov129-Isochrysis_galbana.AAC.3